MIRVVVLYMPKVSMISYFFSRHKVFYGSVALLFLIGALRFTTLPPDWETRFTMIRKMHKE